MELLNVVLDIVRFPDITLYMKNPGYNIILWKYPVEWIIPPYSAELLVNNVLDIDKLPFENITPPFFPVLLINDEFSIITVPL